MASLSRFLSKAIDKSLPLFQCLRKNDHFSWTDDCEKAFEELKKSLASPPILTKPHTNFPLLIYLSASDSGVSTVLVQEQGNSQMPIYFISRILQGAEVRYCQEVGIRMMFTPVEHPQSNGQAESANKVVLSGLKKRVEDSGLSWVEELPKVLRSYHTTVHSSTQYTPFNLVYGTDAMILVELSEPFACTLGFSKEESELGSGLGSNFGSKREGSSKPGGCPMKSSI
uniref:Retrovirus-related Pol polyprotein from transposon 412 family n=1 Tax=Cajanus cajan TaxID=3821 RepID=A0A151R7S7_CAJCA|nr:Retrovirus-related Pol polyprotein from transposon 412 family [Cajanus cajan]